MKSFFFALLFLFFSKTNESTIFFSDRLSCDFKYDKIDTIFQKEQFPALHEYTHRLLIAYNGNLILL